MRVLILAFLLLSEPALSFEWQDLWLTKDQQAMKLYEDGLPSEAAELFKNPQWQGVGAYQAGDFKKAIESFSEDSESLNSQYNLANAKAKSGDLEKARDAYNQLLENDKLDTKLREDTLFNRDLVEKLLHQQEQQQQQKQNSEESENSESDDSEKSDEQQSQDQSSNSEDNSGSSDNASQQQDDASSEEAQNQDESRQDKQDNEESEKEEDAAVNESTQDSQNDKENAEQQEMKEQQEGQGMENSEPLTEEQQALEQWLRRIPDDPSGLLRRKLIQSHKNEYSDVGNEGQAW